MDGARKTGAEEAQPPEGKGEREQSRQEEEEEPAEAPRGLSRGGKNRELEQEQEEEQLSKEWEEAKRWSRMDRLAKELTAKKRLEGEDEDDDPDRSMKLSFRARAYDFRGPGLQLRRGWRPSSREDSVEAGLPLQVRSYLEEKKEEEGSANRRPEVGMGRAPAPGQASRMGAPATRAAPAPTEGTQSVPVGLRPERHTDRGLSGVGHSWGRAGAGAGRGGRVGQQGAGEAWLAGRREREMFRSSHGSRRGGEAHPWGTESLSQG